MNRVLFLILVLFIQLNQIFSQEESHYASNYRFGFKGNFILTKFLSGTPEKGLGGQGNPTNIQIELNNRPEVGFGFDAFIEIYFPIGFSSHSEIDISYVDQQITYKKNVGGPEPVEIKANYLMNSLVITLIPIGIKYEFRKEILPFIYLCPSINAPISNNRSGKIEIKEYNPIINEYTQTVKFDNEINDAWEKSSFGLLIGVGFQLPIRNFQILIELNSDIGLTDIMESPSYKKNSFLISLGYIIEK